jgi:hypothetical protein
VVVVLDVPPFPEAITSHLAGGGTTAGTGDRVVTGRPCCDETSGFCFPCFPTATLRDTLAS